MQTSVAGGEQPAEHIPYTITGQEPREEMTPDGRFVQKWRVYFEAPNETHDFIDVRENQRDPATVDALIEARLDTTMGIHGLGPEPHPDNTAE